MLEECPNTSHPETDDAYLRVLFSLPHSHNMQIETSGQNLKMSLSNLLLQSDK